VIDHTSLPLLATGAVCRHAKLADDLTEQMKANQAVSGELSTLSDAQALTAGEVARIKKETERLAALQALSLRKVEEAEEKRAAEAAKVEDMRREVEELEEEVASERRRLEVKRTSLDDLRREKDVLSRTLATAEDRSRNAAEVVAAQESARRNLQAELAGYASTMRRLREQIDGLEEQRLKYAAQAEEAQQVRRGRRGAACATTANQFSPPPHAHASGWIEQAYYTALEGVKLQELQMAALQRKIEEGGAKLKQQQSLYDAVKADRNMYLKNLSDANAEIGEMRRAFKQLSHTIDSVRTDIEAKDAALIREHSEHHRVEKDKESLRNEVTRIQKQVQSCDQILASQEIEMAKLNAIIAEADAERGRQQKEYDAVVAERNLLQGQLVKRDAELAALYERLRVQKSSLANGAASYAKLAAERDDLAARIAALKGELLVAQTQTSDVGSLEAEAKRLEADLRAEKTKIRSLTEEVERPINIHRWRALSDRDPERWALIQRIHALQKRVVESRDEIRVKEARIGEREREYAKLKEALARQPGPEVLEAISTYQATLKEKAKQLKALEGELDTYRDRVGEYRRELARIDESMEGLNEAYMRRMRASRRGISMAGGGGGWGGGGGGGAGGGIDEAALLDVSAEMRAAGLMTRGGTLVTRQGGGGLGGGAAGGAGGGGGGGGGGRGVGLPGEAVAAVKDEADRLLAEMGMGEGDGDEGKVGSGEGKR